MKITKNIEEKKLKEPQKTFNEPIIQNTHIHEKKKGFHND